MLRKEVKIGVREGDDIPAFRWNVLILDLAFNEAMELFEADQYEHVAEQIKELARGRDPSHPIGQRVDPIEGLFEFKDKGGPLGRKNIRVFFGIDKASKDIVVLGVIQKQNEGATPLGDRERMARRWRKYRAGDYGLSPGGRQAKRAGKSGGERRERK